jgi:hypothetical protein
MAKISTYPVVAPASNDLITVTDVSESNETKNVTVGSLTATVYSGAYVEIYDDTSGPITNIASANTFVLLGCGVTRGASNDVSLANTAAGKVTNNGVSRTFMITYSVSGSALNLNNLMFRLAVNGNTISYSESDTIVTTAKASSVSNSIIYTLGTGDYVEIYVANSSAQNVTLEHLNLIVRQI